MAKRFSCRFAVTPSIPTRIVESERGIDMNIDVDIIGSYSYFVENDDTLKAKGIDIDDTLRRTELEARIAENIKCSIRLEWTERCISGIRYEKMQNLVKDIIPVIIADLKGSFGRTFGISVDVLEIQSVKENPADVVLYKNAVREYKLANGLPVEDETASNISVSSGAVGESIEEAFHAIASRNESVLKRTHVAYKWMCRCGRTNDKFFCSGCGCPRDQADKWICGCGFVNKGHYCTKCGAKWS